ncbi:MAG TPA: hypothetical protein VD884_12390 [Ohtaekwangia sp.]|nr:hypothetical protein [Ohtaekwangia sp.]
MFIYKWLNLSVLVLMLISCGKPTPVLENFDSQKWKDDRQACQKFRTDMAEDLIKQKQKLLSLSEMEIVEVLGKPDQSELFTRNQKFYYYFVQPSTECAPENKDAERLVIRFNAVGLAKEIQIQ